MNLSQSVTLSLLVTLLTSLVFMAEASNPAAIQEFAIPYPEPPPCPSQTSHGTHPESTHEITYDANAPTPSHLWVTGQNDDAIVRIGTSGAINIYAVPPCSGPHGVTFDYEKQGERKGGRDSLTIKVGWRKFSESPLSIHDRKIE